MHADVIERYNNLEFNEWPKVQWDSAERTLGENPYLLPQFFVEYVVTLDGGAANFQNRWE